MIDILLYKHTDLDGMGTELVMEDFCEKNGLTMEVVAVPNPQIMSEILGRVVEDKSFLDYDRIIIADLSITEDCLKNVVWRNPQLRDKLLIADHHSGLDWLHNGDWAHIIPVDPETGFKQSGTKVLQTVLGHEITSPVLYDILAWIDMYDTWNWKTVYNGASKLPLLLNRMYYALGHEDFKEIVRMSVDHDTPIFDHPTFESKVKDSEAVYNAELDRCIRVIEKKLDREELDTIHYIGWESKMARVMDIHGIGHYYSEIANDLLERFESDFDVLRILDYDGLEKDIKVSLRTVRRDIDLSKFARLHGGGGHPQASGYQIPKEGIA